MSNKINSLETLRGIAALMVALYHYPSTSFLYFEDGFLAVYFFFSLSGFVITLNYFNKINKLSNSFFLKGIYDLKTVDQKINESIKKVTGRELDISTKEIFSNALMWCSLKIFIADSKFTKKEQELFDSETEILVGTNKFINKTDLMAHDLELFPFVKQNPRKTLIIPIIEKRLAEQLEKERLSQEKES